MYFIRVHLFPISVIPAKKACMELGISAIYIVINEISIAGAFKMVYNVTNQDQQ